jgi:hypothetical protein
MRSDREEAPPGSVTDNYPTRSSEALRSQRRLGPVEWSLIALIIIAVAVTGAMAIFNPS